MSEYKAHTKKSLIFLSTCFTLFIIGAAVTTVTVSGSQFIKDKAKKLFKSKKNTPCSKSGNLNLI